MQKFFIFSRLRAFLKLPILACFRFYLLTLRSIFYLDSLSIFFSKGKNIKIRIISRHIFFSHFEGKTQPHNTCLIRFWHLLNFLHFLDFLYPRIQTITQTHRHHIHINTTYIHVRTLPAPPQISTLALTLQNSPSPTFHSHPTQLTTRSLAANTNCLKNKNNLKNSICGM